MDIDEIIIKHNPQWRNGSIETGIFREILPRVITALETRHVKAITGARRSGKSYLFRQIISHLYDNGVESVNVCQINFEDPWFISHRESPDVLSDINSRYMQIHNPKGMVYLFLDEIQNIANWQYWVRDIYDRETNVRIFIAGSNSDLLSAELATHLTGRVLSYEIFPFSFNEYLSEIDDISLFEIDNNYDSENIYRQLYHQKDRIIHYLERSFKRGFFPEIVFLENEELIEDILLQYYQNVLFKDIVPRYSIRNTRDIEQLAYYLSANITSPYSYKKLAEMVQADEKTVKEYISYFEKAYLLFQVEYFEYSVKRRFRRNKKIYALDCGLRNATALTFSEDRGKNAENTVYIHLRRTFDSIFYWQEDRSQKEVDFVVKDKGRTLAVNISYTDKIPEREFEALKTFSSYTKIDRYFIVSRDIFEKRIVENITVEIIPLWVFLLMKLK